MKNGLTIRDAAERWVHEMNAIPQGMIEKLMNIGDEDIHEVTEPSVAVAPTDDSLLKASLK